MSFIAVGSPMWDTYVLMENCNKFLMKHGLREGDATPLRLESFQNLCKAAQEFAGKDKCVQGCGGCAANAAKVQSRLGLDTAFCGSVGTNNAAINFRKGLENSGISDLTCSSNIEANGEVLCLINADNGQRTFAYHAGASSALELDSFIIRLNQWRKNTYIRNHRILVAYFDAYTLLHPNSLTELAMKSATEAGALVGFNTGSVGIVRQERVRMRNLIQNYCSILIVNEEEALALAKFETENLNKSGSKKNQEESSSRVYEACLDLSSLMINRNGLCVVTVGEKGCWCCVNSDINFYPSTNVVKAKDTTGAGDYFAGGFCASLIQKWDKEGKVSTSQQLLMKSVRLGQTCATAVVSHLGTDLPDIFWTNLKFELNT